MHPLPHLYRVTATADPTGDVSLSAPGLPALASDGPTEFDGPGDRWSPETLVCAALADCFILTFRAVARASQLAWLSLSCEVEGTLDKVDRAMQFTAFVVRPRLVVPAEVGEDFARRALDKTERACIILNSLNGARRVEASVVVAGRDSTA